MRATGIIRRIDDLGRVVIPKEIRRTFKIKEGDPLEIYTKRDGSIIFKPYRQPWEETVIEWYEANMRDLRNLPISFIHSGDDTICTIWNPEKRRYEVGKARRFYEDDPDQRIGKVAAYARAIRVPINKLVGYED